MCTGSSWRTIQPDIVVLDLGMPRMDGYEAARRIRAEPWGTAATLIALTGWGQEGDRQRTREAGFDHHLLKPADYAALAAVFAAAARDAGDTSHGGEPQGDDHG